MNYSRRQLYALGESLGDSVTTKKVGGGRIYGGGGGGGGSSGPTNTTSYNTNIPEYAKPYVTTMLGATQQQLFNGTTDDQGNYNITGFKPYTPYSSDVNKYFAGFSPMQQQAQQATANLQVPGQYQQAMGMTGLGAMGSLGLAGQMGQAGQQFAQQAQDPNAMRGYMSPYMQNVVDYQKSQALRDYQMGAPKLQAAAVGQGAFGGNRLALQQAEAQRGLMSQLQGIEATGAQQAFQNAQAQQQFGANLGLQGQQAALGGLNQYGSMANQLAALGGQQLGAQQNIIAAQNQYGAQQQQLEQQKINQAIQDYATAQQYPLMQLGFMSNMLRGLPLQATTTQTYQAMPSMLNQGLGTLAGVAGAKQAGLFAEGGTVKGLAAGGVAKYANRGLTEANPQSQVVRGVKAKLEMMPDDQLVRIAQTSPSEEVRTMALEVLNEHKMREQAEQQAQASIQKDQARQPAMPTPVSEGVGLPAAPAGAMDTLSAASGGIVAFADEGEVKYDPYAIPTDEETIARIKKRNEALGITGKPYEKYGQYLEKENAGLPDVRSQNKGYTLLDYGVNLATQAGPLLYAGSKAAKEILPGAIARNEAAQSREDKLAKGLADLENADRLEQLGYGKQADDIREKAYGRVAERDRAKLQAQATMASANRPTDLDKTTDAFLKQMLAEGAPNNAATMAAARQKAIETTGLALRKVEATESTAVTNAIAKDPEIGEKGTITSQLKLLKIKPNPTDEDKAKMDDLEDQIAARKTVITNRITRQEARAPKPAAEEPKVPKAPDISTVTGAPEGAVIGSYVKDKGWEIRKDGKLVGYAQGKG